MTVGLVHIINDDPEAIAELLTAAGTGRFEHKVAELRQRREDEKAYQNTVNRSAGQGYTILDATPHYGDPSCVELRYLNTAEGQPATEDAITDPAHWAVYIVEDTILVDEQTGDEVDRDNIDWHCRFSASSQPEDGKRHPNTVTEKDVWVADWYCTDYVAAGLALCETLAKRVDAIARENAAADNGSAATSGDDAQDDDAREAARKEELRQERRKVIALNKLGAAAEAVRRTWIREKLRSRKTAPKGGARFVAQCLTRDIRLVEEYHGSGIAAELLGLGDSAAMNTHARELGVKADGRAQVVTLALVLGALEARTGKDAWRYGGRGDQWCGPVDLLQFLRANGYELADVERIVTGELDSDAVFTRLIKQDLVPSPLGLDLVQRNKTLPKGAATFVADCLARDSYMLTQHNRDEVTAELLEIDAAAIHTAVSDLPAGSDNRALVIALGLVLGSLEAKTGKDAWRNPAPAREPGDDRIYYGRSVTSGDYLRFLAANGYTLAAVEEVITGSRTAADAYDTYLRDKENPAPDDQ